MMTTEPLTNTELTEHVRTALGGVGPQQVKRVMKGVRGLCDRAEAAERRVQELAAALDYWRERAMLAEAKLAAQQTAACPHCGKPLDGLKLAPF